MSSSYISYFSGINLCIDVLFTVIHIICCLEGDLVLELLAAHRALDDHYLHVGQQVLLQVFVHLKVIFNINIYQGRIQGGGSRPFAPPWASQGGA